VAKLVLADPDRYRAAYDKPGLLDAWNWEVQAGILDELYGRLVAQPVTRPVADAGLDAGRAGIDPTAAPQAS
jgi:glycogen(starch) synthase